MSWGCWKACLFSGLYFMVHLTVNFLVQLYGTWNRRGTRMCRRVCVPSPASSLRSSLAGPRLQHSHCLAKTRKWLGFMFCGSIVRPEPENDNESLSSVPSSSDRPTDIPSCEQRSVDASKNQIKTTIEYVTNKTHKIFVLQIVVSGRNW